MSSQRWSDDELLQELGAALRELPLDESVIRAAEAAFSWRTVDATLSCSALMLVPVWPPARWSAAAGQARRTRWCSMASG